MNRLKLNYWIDVALAISLFISFSTGLAKWPGIIKIIGVSAYRFLHVPSISVWHDWSGLVLGLLVLIHLVLHWNWIVAATKSIFKKK